MHPALAAILARPIAHRGLHDAAEGRVENSLEAAEAAAAAGFGIECDVQVSRDGEAIVFHDDTLDRLSAGRGALAEQDAAALALVPLTGGGLVPTLAAFLEQVAGRVPVVIEIKSRFDGDFRLATRTTALVESYSGAVAVKSFDGAVIARCRELGARCPLGLVGEGEPRPPPESLDFLSWRVADLAGLRAREPRLPLMSWTVRSAAQAGEAARFGAQIIFEHFLPPAGTAVDPPKSLLR